MSYLEKKYKDALKEAGVPINTSDNDSIRVNNKEMYRKIFFGGSLGLGESYMDGDWDCDRLDIAISKILKYLDNKNLTGIESTKEIISKMLLSIFNLQSKARSFIVGEKHYDTGNDLFELMLDKYMIYSCGYWKGAKNLDQAQENKLKLIFDKLGLKKGMKVLDIGCGWGGAAKYASENYGVEVVGVTVSVEQAKYAREFCKGLPIQIQVKDYRDIEGTFDRVYSIGMFEHVGVKNYKDYMKVVDKVLTDDGLFLLHTIGTDVKRRLFNSTNPWVHKYIFPNAVLPYLHQISKSIKGSFVIEDLQNIGPDYAKTLMAWNDNFDKNWDLLKGKYDDRFYRMWRYYLFSFMGMFEIRYINLWQIVISEKRKKGQIRQTSYLVD